jgi:hypothetical protein
MCLNYYGAMFKKSKKAKTLSTSCKEASVAREQDRTAVRPKSDMNPTR